MRYLAIVCAIIAWYALLRAPIGPEHALPDEMQSAALIERSGYAMPEFELLDHHGTRFDNARLQSTWTVLALAYRACSTPCPDTLSALSKARDSLLDIDPGAADGAWLVASLEPEVDTPEPWARYLSGFSDSLLGVTGAIADMTTVLEALGAGDTPRPGQVYVFAPGATLLARFDPPLDAAILRDDLRLIRHSYPDPEL